ncbi:MAG: response regulator [Deltaproteobacteria bacterium]|nr:response regulator [Deltaproteobacteria bacterium]
MPPNVPPLGRILVVDDEHELLAALTDALSAQGYDTTGCDSGAAALAALRERPFDAVLSDLMMPGMDGIALLREALTLAPDLAGIIMTGQGTIQSALEAMKSGAFDYVLKPFKLSLILPVLSRAVAVRRLREENVQLQQAVAIYELSHAIAETLDLDTVLEQVAEAALAQARADGVCVLLPGESGGELRVARSRGRPCRWALGEPLLAFEEGAPADSALLPMRAGNALTGAIHLHFSRPRRGLTTGERKALGLLTTIAGSAVQNAQLHAQLQEEAQVTAALARVGREMISSLDTPVLLNRLCQLTVELLQCDVSHTFQLRPEHGGYVATAGAGDSPEQFQALQVTRIAPAVLVGLLARLQTEAVVAAGTGAAPPPLGGAGALLCGALRRGEQIIGLHTAGRLLAQPFTPRQQRLAAGIAQLGSLALANAYVAEELQQVNQLKSDFVATISHELRTPLHVIMGYNQLLESEGFGPVSGEQIEVLRQMQASAEDLLRLVNATLDLGRLESGRLPLRFGETQAGELLRQVEGETAALRAAKPLLRFSWQAAADTPPLVTDLQRLKVVLRNLIDNAVKFTAAGGVTVSIAGREGGVEIAVADTGIGIAPEVFPIIFEPFRQGEHAMTRRYGGVGLGLYIARRMLDALGGTISAESVPGQGSTFRVRLPVRSQRQAA